MSNKLPQGRKRGYGACDQCAKEYSNRSKREYCDCGNLLGGKFNPGSVNEKVVRHEKSSITVFVRDSGTLVSHKTTPRGDRHFVFYSQNQKICYTKRCLELRSAHGASNDILGFSCKHIEDKSKCFQPVYEKSFTEREIQAFTPDPAIQIEMMDVQSEDDSLPSVVKLSEFSYAVKGRVTTTTPLRYTHVILSFGKNPLWYCSNKQCSKKSGKTKQVHGRKVCLHLHFMQLAKQLELECNNTQNINNEGFSHLEKESSIKSNVCSKKTIEAQMCKQIPLVIPPAIACLSDKMEFDGDIQNFEPPELECCLCGSQLSEAMNQQGNQSGYLITNKDPFKKICIKIKKCTNKDQCGLTAMLFPYDLGLFNSCNKVLVGLDILLEWREYLKDGVPLSNIITRKLNALLLKIDCNKRPTQDEVDYLVQVLYNGFYGFESMTKRDLNDVICGYCGIAGRVLFGDGNEKNCCSLKDVILSDPDEANSETGDVTNKLDKMIENIRFHVTDRCTFAKPKYNFKINIQNISPLIPEAIRKAEINTEPEKKSNYLKKSTEVKGDPLLLSKLLKDMKISIKDIDEMDNDKLRHICQYCNISVSGKSKDMMKLEICSLYADIIIGKSNCHQFVKTPGHTGGFYHLVCPHGTTVCSKFMMLTESVRDAADLWLSLKYPPLLFVCDTPCTFVRHVNGRCPDESEQYWGNYDGCFEVPNLDKLPTSGQDVSAIVQGEFRNENVTPKDYGSFKHPLTGTKQRYVCGDRFHSKVDPHKSPLCAFHDLDLCKQAQTIKTSYQESFNNKKNKKRNRSACTQDILHYIFYNFLMDFYDNQEVVAKQKAFLEKESGKPVSRDPFMRFVFGQES